MLSWNEVLIKKAQPIVKELRLFPETRAITFYGSIGAGYADEFSDIDIMVFCTKVPDKKHTKKIYKKFKIKLWPNLTSSIQGFSWDRRDWTIFFKEISSMEHDIKSFLSEKNEWWENQIANYLDRTIIVYDPDNIVKAWKKKIKKYPLWLKRKNFSKIDLVTTKIEKIFKGLQRENLVLIQDALSACLENLIHILYSLNNKLFSSSEWFFKDIKKFRVTPPNCLKKIEAIARLDTTLTEKMKLIGRMVEDIEKLCKKQIPSLELRKNSSWIKSKILEIIELDNYTKQTIVIKPYDPKLKTYFKKEKNFLIKKLDKNFEIHHIGSSAVPRLGGKNIVDILLLAPTKRIANNAIKKLESMGYFHNKNAGDKYRIFFNRNRFYNKKKVHIHLHLMWKTVKKYKDYLAFRDYLRKHPKEAKRYYLLKKMWVKKAGKIGEKYTEMKTNYVKEVLRKAKK
jgi:GrpB-like predicted nucleotidyltransferase (UPF0157 family)/predicted nucleotidyltransferase